MTNKKYYWIKLKTNFFNTDVIEFLLSQKNGCEYVVLYQMLCLKTANTNGSLKSEIGEMIVPFTVDKIVRDTKYFDTDTVVVALEFYKKLGLIYEGKDNCLMISNYSEMVGSETDYALKKRAYREKRKLLQSSGQCLGQIEDNVRQEYRDKSIEYRDKSIDKEIERNTSASSDKENRSQHSTMPSVIELILNDKSLFPIHQDDIDLWSELYPSVDIMQELRKMKGWLDSNPTKRKTKNGIKRFINSWLSREQDRGYPKQYQDQMPDYMKKQEKGEIVSTPVSDEALAKALELQRQFKGK